MFKMSTARKFFEKATERWTDTKMCRHWDDWSGVARSTAEAINEVFSHWKGVTSSEKHKMLLEQRDEIAQDLFIMRNSGDLCTGAK